MHGDFAEFSAGEGMIPVFINDSSAWAVIGAFMNEEFNTEFLVEEDDEINIGDLVSRLGAR